MGEWLEYQPAAPLGFLRSWADYLVLQTGKRQAKTMGAICLLNLRSFFGLQFQPLVLPLFDPLVREHELFCIFSCLKSMYIQQRK